MNLEKFEAGILTDMPNSYEPYVDEYKKLDKRSSNEIHLKSWFKDQVLHPKETQHTLAEILPIIKSKYKIISTSLNKFEQIHNLEQIVEEEEKWFNSSLLKLKKYI
mgnify:CR=1 FL=1